MLIESCSRSYNGLPPLVAMQCCRMPFINELYISTLYPGVYSRNKLCHVFVQQCKVLFFWTSIIFKKLCQIRHIIFMSSRDINIYKPNSRFRSVPKCVHFISRSQMPIPGINLKYFFFNHNCDCSFKYKQISSKLL